MIPNRAGPGGEGAEPPGQPRYVRECGQHSLLVWPTGAPADCHVQPARCISWRCETCAPEANKRLAWRIAQGMKRRGGAAEHVFGTLTLAQRAQTRRGVRSWNTREETYRELGRLWCILRRRLERRGWGHRWLGDTRRECPLCGRIVKRAALAEHVALELGGSWGERARELAEQARPPARVSGVQVVEQHRSGWPHVHLVWHLPKVSAELAELDDQQRERWIRRELRPELVAAGYGPRADLQAIDDEGGLPWYLAGVAEGEAAAARELAKAKQLPRSAGRKFRRFRATPGYLPPWVGDPAYEARWMVEEPAELARRLERRAK